MSRLPRFVTPGHPHHVTQRRNRRLHIFFEESDYVLYRDMLAEAAKKPMLKSGHIVLCKIMFHIIIVSSDADGERRTFADVHRRYTG